MGPVNKSSSHPAKKDSSLRMKHRLEKRLQFHDKVKNTFKSLTATKTIAKNKKQRSRQRRNKAYDLSNLAEFLPDMAEKKVPAPTDKSKLNCKSKQKLVEKEARQLGAVLGHPRFIADPISAIHQHFELTLCPQSDQEPKQEKRCKKVGSRKHQKTRSKVQRAQSMEI